MICIYLTLIHENFWPHGAYTTIYIAHRNPGTITNVLLRINGSISKCCYGYKRSCNRKIRLENARLLHLLTKNKQEDEKMIYRELVKETQGSHTNDYTKLVNIIFDKETEIIRIENQVYDADVDVDKYCQLAEELYLKF